MNDPLAIQAALIGLHKRYPSDTVAAWWDIHPEGTDSVTFRLHNQDHLGFRNAWGHGATIEAAVASLVADAGERNPEKLRQAKIAELRDQLAKLEGNL